MYRDPGILGVCVKYSCLGEAQVDNDNTKCCARPIVIIKTVWRYLCPMSFLCLKLDRHEQPGNKQAYKALRKLMRQFGRRDRSITLRSCAFSHVNVVSS